MFYMLHSLKKKPTKEKYSTWSRCQASMKNVSKAKSLTKKKLRKMNLKGLIASKNFLDPLKFKVFNCYSSKVCKDQQQGIQFLHKFLTVKYYQCLKINRWKFTDLCTTSLHKLVWKNALNKQWNRALNF